jgi:hypothetical protein
MVSTSLQSWFARRGQQRRSSEGRWAWLRTSGSGRRCCSSALGCCASLTAHQLFSNCLQCEPCGHPALDMGGWTMTIQFLRAIERPLALRYAWPQRRRTSVADSLQHLQQRHRQTSNQDNSAFTNTTDKISATKHAR